MPVYGSVLYGSATYGSAAVPVVPPSGTAPAGLPAFPVLVSVATVRQVVAPPTLVQDEPADLLLDPATGDYALGPAGALAAVTGQQRAVMDLWSIAKQPKGTHIPDPDHGNPLARRVGAPMPDQAASAALVNGLAAALGDLQARRAADGLPPGASEAVQRVTVDALSIVATAATASITAVFGDGSRTQAPIPLAGLST